MAVSLQTIGISVLLILLAISHAVVLALSKPSSQPKKTPSNAIKAVGTITAVVGMTLFVYACIRWRDPVRLACAAIAAISYPVLLANLYVGNLALWRAAVTLGVLGISACVAVACLLFFNVQVSSTPAPSSGMGINPIGFKGAFP